MSVIQVLKPKFRKEEILLEISECLDKGWTGIGYKTEQIEKKWSEYTGHNHSLFLNSATSALHLAVKVFKEFDGWIDGDEIITTSLTFVSTNHAILYENMTPVFADIDDSLCLDPSSVEKMIGPRTKAVIFVGIGGNAQNYHSILEICKRRNLRLILDAAHMSGSRWNFNMEHVGLDADCVCYSFQAVKNLPTSDSGMLCFQDLEKDLMARKLSWLGIDKSTFDRYTESSYKWKYDVPYVGYKYNGNSINAAIALVSLKYLDEDNAYRRLLTNMYLELLKSVSEVKIIHHSNELLSSRHLFQIAVDKRDEFIDFFAEEGIYPGVHYIPNHLYKPYKSFKRDVANCEVLSERLISLPLHLNMTASEVERVVYVLKKAISKITQKHSI